MSRLSQYQHDPAFAIVTGACPHDCPDTCSWQVAVEKSTGRAVDIWGHTEHPVTRGKLCGKVDRYLERTYHPGRLTTPLKRVGPKGSGQFVPVRWDEAMQEIASRLKQIIAQHGPEAVLPYSYAGTMGLLQAEGMASRFWNRMGASRLARTICSEPGFQGWLYTIGATESMLTEDFAHARLILIWGSNTLTSNLHLWPFIQEARKAGARVIVIDPARTRTAQAADEWIAIRPGTDAALALAMMHVIIAEGLTDEAYVPARAAAITGVPAERITRLAREYATVRPAAIRLNYGLNRHYGGGMAVRTITCLPALVGAWRELGGGAQLSTSGFSRHLDRTALHRPDLLAHAEGLPPGKEPRTLNMIRLADALSTDRNRLARAFYHPRPVDPVTAPEATGSPVHALVVYDSNPAAVTPEQASVVEGLKRDDLFTVVLEHFMTDTADYADFVLPATTQIEHWDLQKAYGHTYIGLNRPAIAPVGESLPNSEIFRRLAQAMGYRETCFHESDEEILQALVTAQTHPRFAGVTWARLMADGFAPLDLPVPCLPFAEGGFFTPSGKCEFYSAQAAADGYDPLPSYTAPLWQQGALAELLSDEGEDGLVCISPPAHSFLNTTFANIPRFLKREDQPLVRIHPQDAAARNLQSGDRVRVVNKLGSVELAVELSDGIIPGTILAPGIWWSKFSPNQRNINQIVPQYETDMGGGPVFYDTLVKLVKITEAEPAAAQPETVVADH
jgi:anaerobic selenocysteine-containing dehydrogenase